MNIEVRIREYLSEYQALCNDLWAAGKDSNELATRPQVHTFLADLVKEIQPSCRIEHDTAVSGTSNRPDWIFTHPEHFGVYCYGDHKSLNPYSPFELSAAEARQIERYLAMGRPVFVFDGLEFLFFDGTLDSIERQSLIDKASAEAIDWSTMPINSSVEVKLRELFGAPGFRPWTESQLVKHLAARARALSDSILEQIVYPRGAGLNEEENELIGALHDLKELVANHHDPGLSDDKTCADFISQVLIFGIFYAHTKSLVRGDTPEERKSEIDGFWSSEAWREITANLRPFNAVHEILSSQLQLSNSIATWYRDAMSLLSHAECLGTEGEPSDYHSLFETFLAEFDPVVRFDRGAFFTPIELTQWMVAVSQELSFEHFGGAIPELADKVIDPCCGTGGYVEALLRQLDFSVDEAAKVVGFEVLPGPYALAKYRVDQVFQELGSAAFVEILLTDTLADQLENPPEQADNGFSQEHMDASEYARPPVWIVIGNPPSSDQVASDAPRKIIQSMMDEFRPPEEARGARQNIQQALNNEAYRFLRWSANKVLSTGAGVVSLVLPGALARSASFSSIRRWLIESFDFLYVFVFDRDGRTGVSGNSLFNVQQGRLVILCVKCPDIPEQAGTSGQVLHLDISSDPTSQKRSFLNSREGVLSEFQPIHPSEPQYLFSPASDYDEELWSASWPLYRSCGVEGLFVYKCSGVKLAPTHLLFHTDSNVLLRRSLELGAKSGDAWRWTYEELVGRWWEGQQKVPAEGKFSDGVRQSISECVSGDRHFVDRYIYRPFQPGYCLQKDSVYAELGKTPGDGTRRRPEVIAAFEQGAIGICVAPSTEDLGSSLHRFVSFADAVPDNDNVARGNAMVFCNAFPEPKPRRGEWDKTAKENVTEQVRDVMGETFGTEEMVFYVYAVMNSSKYLRSFEGVLFGPSNPDAPPRVPLLNDEELVQSIVNLGREMASFEVGGANAPMLESLDYQLPEEFQNFRLSSATLKVDAGEVVLKGDGKTVSVSGIPSEILSLQISGHPVVKKWLRERQFNYLRRPIVEADVSGLLQLISNIQAQNEIIERVSGILDDALAIDNLIPPTELDPNF